MIRARRKIEQGQTMSPGGCYLREAVSGGPPEEPTWEQKPDGRESLRRIKNRVPSIWKQPSSCQCKEFWQILFLSPPTNGLGEGLGSTHCWWAVTSSQDPPLSRFLVTSQGKRNFLPAVNKRALSSPHWGHRSSSYLSAQKQTRVTRDVECGWANFPWSFVLGEGNEGEFAGIGGAAIYLRKLQNTLRSLCPNAFRLSGHHLPAAAARRPVGGVPPLPVCSCFWLDHRTLSCQSSCGYTEQERISQNALRNLRHWMAFRAYWCGRCRK